MQNRAGNHVEVLMRRKIQTSRQMTLGLPEPRNVQLLLEENRRLSAENQRLRTQTSTLMEELERLRQFVNGIVPHHDVQKGDAELPQGVAVREKPASHMVTKRSRIDEKVALFRSYFKGRDDVYAVRGAERGGKAPYYPKRKYLGRDNGEVIWGDNLPLTVDVIRAHLLDEKHPVTIGIYPLLLDETCWFLAIDFDKASWKNDATAFLQTCQRFNVPAALERSRSGNGGHVWIFFQEPVLARTARALGSTLLTRTLAKRHQIGLDSYDRMFPNQDTLPRDKKLGNLIALPLQRLPGKEGNSLFIDANFNPYPDQWIFLSSLRKMKLSEVETVVREADLKGNIVPVAKPLRNTSEGTQSWDPPLSMPVFSFHGALPKTMRVILANMLYIEKQGLSSSQISYLKRFAAFQNPEFYKAQAMRLSTYGKPRIIDCSEESAEYIVLPRDCQEEVSELLHQHGSEMILEDKRNHKSQIHVPFHGKLRPEQHRAVTELSKYDFGTLSATTAFGKTVVGAWMIAARATNTLVLVHRTQLMEQWREQLSVFLNIPKEEIGAIGGGKNKRTGLIDVALIQSLYVNREVKDLVADYGHIVVDECHHISAMSFEQVLKHATAKYVLGLTATLTRKDGKHPIVLMQCGPVRYKVDARSQAKTRPFAHVVVPRHTNFKLSDSESEFPIQQ